MASLQTSFSAISTVSNLLFGAAGAVTLGPVTFFGQEVPERISIGGAQALRVYKYPGGQRTIDAMGRDDAPLAWSGMMIGPYAEQRMLLLDNLRVAGQPLTLTFGTMTYTVIIETFTGHYLRTNHCVYEIGCVVQQDNSAQFAAATPTVAQQIASDAASALTYASTALAVISTAQAALGVSGATSLDTSAYGAAALAVGAAQTAVSADITSNGAVMAGLVGGSNGILGPATGYQAAGAAIANMAAATEAAGDLGNLVIASGYLARTATNLANAGA